MVEEVDMWTKQGEIFDFCKNYLDDVSLDDLLKSLSKLKINVEKNDVMNVISEMEKGLFEPVNFRKANVQYENKKYEFNEEEYVFVTKSLSVYKRNCSAMATILYALSQDFEKARKMIECLDLTVEQDEILTKDLLRILKPLKKNYELVNLFCEKGNNPLIYVKQENSTTKTKKKKLPTAGLLDMNIIKPNDELIQMTEKQRKQRVELKKNLRKQIYEKSYELNEKDC